MLDLVWLIPLLALAGAAVNLFLGRRLGKAAGWLATALVGLGFVLAVATLVDLLGLPADQRAHVTDLFDWISVGTFNVDVALRVDPLSITMLLVVTGVGSLIHLYAIGYMEHDPRFGTFFAYLNLFVFFMLMLVLADNYLLLYLGWEGVGLCSYLLIGFWYERPLASSAAKKAFVTTRIGDAAMLLGIVLIFLHVGSLDFGVVFGPGASELTKGTATAISLLLLAGAIGKSAQLPLHVWLPDAMEGPTPVSALIHAATMVTAGVYLVVRSHVLFELSGTALTVVLVVGLVSALYAALASIGQFDLKRALAYSTMSQIGFMFFAAGMRFYTGAMLLLVCHAFYKALLFLTAGNVLHGLHDETDMRRMGGLRAEMPLSATWFAIGALSLAGIPPLAGFFAKDQIVGFAATSDRELAWVLASVGAFLSALYIARPLFLTFFGRRRSEEHAHEAPALMHAPLAVLAFLTVVGGLFLGPDRRGRPAGRLPRAGRGRGRTRRGRAVRRGPDRDLDRARGRGGRGGVLGLGLRTRRLGGVPRTPARARRLARERLLPEHALRLAGRASREGVRPSPHRRGRPRDRRGGERGRRGRGRRLRGRPADPARVRALVRARVPARRGGAPAVPGTEGLTCPG